MMSNKLRGMKAKFPILEFDEEREAGSNGTVVSMAKRYLPEKNSFDCPLKHV